MRRLGNVDPVALLDRLRRELPLVLLLLVAGGALWAFAEIADEVVERESRTIDRAILLAMRSAGDTQDPLGPKWLEEMGRDFTALGGVGVLTLITVVGALYLRMHGQSRMALLFVAAIVGAMLANQALKYGFDRPRPDLVAHGSYVYTQSFPSGHSMSAAATYLTLAAMLARAHRRWTHKAFVTIVCVTITLLVGVSRVYLGVHWPTDVAAGWTLGAAWAIGCWIAIRRLQVAGQVEAEE